MKYVLLLVSLFCGYVFAAADDAVFFPDSKAFGLVIHHVMMGESCKSIGADWARFDVSWPSIEKEKGVYDFTDLDRGIDDKLTNGLNVLAIFAFHYTNPAYPDPKVDFDGFVKEYVNFAKIAAKRYKGKVAIWELGNEPDVMGIGVFHIAEKFTVLTREAAKAIREVDKDVHIGALSCGWMDRNFILRSMNAGLLDDGTIDVITFHGYSRGNQFAETKLLEDVQWLRGVIDQYNKKNIDIILVDSERGYSLYDFPEPKPWHTWSNRTYSEQEQAAYLARHYIEEAWLGIEVSIWYKSHYGEEGYSLFEEGPDSRKRKIAYVFSNLSAILSQNPKKMKNDKYQVVLTDIADDNICDANPLTFVRSFLIKTEGSEKLIVAVWEQIESFDGRILDSRQRISDNYYESWRAASPDDKIEIETNIEVFGVSAKTVKSVKAYNLLAESVQDLSVSMDFKLENGILTTDKFMAKPFPQIFVIEINK